ncbi:MAG: 1,2-phenylacetyl-CoA epoxidase subunit PaaD [Burkholderiales bacterium]
MVDTTASWDALDTINDPELPVSIVDLGMVQSVSADSGRVGIDLAPTFVGCPALAVIEQEVRDKLAKLPGVARVDINWVFDPPWSVDRISAAGREALRKHGVTVPPQGGLRPAPGAAPGSLIPLTASAPAETIACPFCGSEATTLESPFGPTRCKMIYYCQACRNSFEHFRQV